jgi:hypothetical protein
MHFSPIVLVSRLQNQHPFCIEERENRVEAAIFQNFFDWIRKEKDSKDYMGDVNGSCELMD